MVIFFKRKGPKHEGEGNKLQRLGFLFFRERGSDFSLRSRPIGPSDFFGAKKQCGSTQQGLRVGTGFLEFQ